MVSVKDWFAIQTKIRYGSSVSKVAFTERSHELSLLLLDDLPDEVFEFGDDQLVEGVAGAG